MRPLISGNENSKRFFNVFGDGIILLVDINKNKKRHWSVFQTETIPVIVTPAADGRLGTDTYAVQCCNEASS